jgi:hypothetical protein
MLLIISGEMELTMLTRVCMSQNISTLMHDLPSGLDVIRQSFVETFDSDQRGTLPNEIGSHHNQIFTFPNSTKTQQIKPEIYDLLQEYMPHSVPLRRGMFQSSINYCRATYSTCDTSEANSLVILGHYPSNTWRAAQISEIIVQEKSREGSEIQYEAFVVVRLFVRLDDFDASKDIYKAQNRTFGVGCLFYKRPRVKKTLIRVGDLTCHFSKNPIPKVLGIKKDCIHVRPLYRVSYISCSYADIQNPHTDKHDWRRVKWKFLQNPSQSTVTFSLFSFPHEPCYPWRCSIFCIYDR